MLNLLQAEWIKLSRRPLAWLLLIIFVLLMALFLGIIFLAVGLSDGAFTGGEARMQIIPREDQLEQFRLMLRFPGIFGTVLSQVNSIGGILAIVLTAGVFGSEYGWGTLRLQLARQPQRGQYLVAKTVALLLFLLLGIALAMLFGSLLGLFFGAVLGNSGQVSASDLLLLPWRMLRSLYVMLPYIMFTVACCVLGRSVLAGAVGGFLFLAADISVGAFSFLTSMGDTLAFIYNLLVVQQNINTLVVLNSQSYGLNPAIITRNLDLTVLPSPLQAVLVIAVYSGSFFAIAYQMFVQRDLTGAT